MAADVPSERFPAHPVLVRGLVPAALHERGHQGVDEFEQPLRVRVVGTGRGLLSYGIDVVLPVRGVGVLPRCRCFAFRWLLALYRR